MVLVVFKKKKRFKKKTVWEEWEKEKKLQKLFFMKKT